MKTFMVTFNQAHPLRDHWVEVDAEDRHEAREKVVQVFGLKFAFLYSIDEFDPDYFPAGRAGHILK
jgi:hypothetical protein